MDPSTLSSAAMAKQTWELENNIVRTADPPSSSSSNDAIFYYDEAAQGKFQQEKPWVNDPHYFKRVKISALALLKMVVHARSGGTIEVMGLMQGKTDGDAIIVMDAFALPVEGTETRVNAQADAYEYMVDYSQTNKQHFGSTTKVFLLSYGWWSSGIAETEEGLRGRGGNEACSSIHLKAGRLENVVGWYHSHPGYGCWLSGIDVSTQMLNQQFQEPFLAVVIDPTRTVSAGKVEIGAFRTYPEGYKPSDEPVSEYQTIPLNKVEDFGVHSEKLEQAENQLVHTRLGPWWHLLQERKRSSKTSYLTLLGQIRLNHQDQNLWLRHDSGMHLMLVNVWNCGVLWMRFGYSYACPMICWVLF
ncbi:hypothetical protein Cgig2_011388 [Carnegiea gigantea]|uniref:COP9 signalosome complex subunit 5 n=1 Tax=Carnegiea gigantea TaxID=171969 RepID=A0A9Q1QNH6_9CARY|nr:hypothetical protein Cgig2_011388 [Carnegiea gigantea]